jgi:hypothetical protein
MANVLFDDLASALRSEHQPNRTQNEAIHSIASDHDLRDDDDDDGDLDTGSLYYEHFHELSESPTINALIYQLTINVHDADGHRR